MDKLNEKEKIRKPKDSIEEPKSVYIASCPICGRVLFKGKPNSYVETGCPKCGEYLKILFSESGYNVVAAKTEKGEMSETVKRGRKVSQTVIIN